MRTRRYLHFLLLGILLTAGLAIGAGAQSVHIDDVDSGAEDFRPGYNQTLDQGEGAAFHWWLRNTGRDGEVHVIVDVLNHDDDWQVVVTPQRFDLAPGEDEVVEVTVTPTKWRDGDTFTRLLRFVMVAQEDGETFMEPRSAEATVSVTDGEDLADEDGEEEDEFLLFGSIPFDLKALGVEDSVMTRFLFQFLLWMVVAALVAWIINPVISSFAKRTKTKVDDLIVDIITWPVFALVLVLIQVSMEYSKTTDTDVDQFILVPILEKVGIIFIFIISMVYLLSMVGIDPSALMAGSVVIGMVLGFALQDTLSNFFAGIILTIDQPFRPATSSYWRTATTAASTRWGCVR